MIEQDFTGIISVSPRYINVSVATVNVCNQHNEIFPANGPRDKTLRTADKFSGHDIYFATGKSCGFDNLLPRISPE